MAKPPKFKHWKVTLTDGAGNAFEGVGQNKPQAQAQAEEVALEVRGTLDGLTESSSHEMTSRNKPKGWEDRTQ